MKDVLDREVTVGDTIVYATRTGSYMRLYKATVVSDEGSYIRVERKTWGDKLTTVALRTPHYVVLLKAAE